MGQFRNEHWANIHRNQAGLSCSFFGLRKHIAPVRNNWFKLRKIGPSIFYPFAHMGFSNRGPRRKMCKTRYYLQNLARPTINPTTHKRKIFPGFWKNGFRVFFVRVVSRFRGLWSRVSDFWIEGSFYRSRESGLTSLGALFSGKTQILCFILILESIFSCLFQNTDHFSEVFEDEDCSSVSSFCSLKGLISRFCASKDGKNSTSSKNNLFFLFSD